MAHVKAPETVGELALLDDTNRSATVTAARESTMAFLSREAFTEIVAPRAELLVELSRLVVRRHLANVRDEIDSTADRNFVVVPLDSKLPLRRFVHQLKTSLRKLGTTLSINSRSFDLQSSHCRMAGRQRQPV